MVFWKIIIDIIFVIILKELDFIKYDGIENIWLGKIRKILGIFYYLKKKYIFVIYIYVLNWENVCYGDILFFIIF